jgi:C-terminal processing protease CtpA/Prc
MMRKLIWPMVVAFFCMTGWALAGSKANPNIKGWEKGGEYDRLYDPKEADTLKGRVVRIMDITPIAGMAVGVGLQIEDKKDKTVEIVHLGPKDFVDISSIGLKEGDQIKVIGAWAELDAQDVMLAVKVKKDEDVQLKVRRTKDGFPFWSMPPEERQREMSGD